MSQGVGQGGGVVLSQGGGVVLSQGGGVVLSQGVVQPTCSASHRTVTDRATVKHLVLTWAEQSLH